MNQKSTDHPNVISQKLRRANDKNAAINTLLLNLTSLQKSDQCNIKEVLYWLSLNSNFLHKLTSNKPSRLLSPCSSYTKLELLKPGKKWSVQVSARWEYDSLEHEPVDLAMLSKYFNGIDANSFSCDIDHYRVGFVIHLEKWPKLVPSILYEKVCNANRVDAVVSTREQDREDVAALINNYYPNINHEVLQVGMDLGMFDSYTLFQSWFSECLSKHADVSVHLPDDVAL